MTLPIQTVRIGDLPLCSGQVLPDVGVAYVSFGTLNAAGDNAVLVTHGLTSGPGMMIKAEGSTEGSWADLLLPGAPLDSNKYFVVCSNVIGSALGSTGPATAHPQTGEPWGSAFPALTMRDIVAAQRRLLAQLGVRHLRAVVGPSYGGMQALQWALDHPAMVSAIGVVVSGLRWPVSLDPADLERRLQAVGWDAATAASAPVRAEMQRVRAETLRSYGFEALYLASDSDPVRCAAAIERAAAAWARQFDADALVCLQRAGARFDVRAQLAAIQCPMLFVTASSDALFPPDADTQALLAKLGDRARYVEIATPYGHLSSGVELHQWSAALHELMQSTPVVLTSTGPHHHDI